MAQWSFEIDKALRSLLDSPNTLPSFDTNAVKTTEDAIESIRQAISESEKTSETPQSKDIILNQYALRLQEAIDLYKRARISRIIQIFQKNETKSFKEMRHSLTQDESDFLTALVNINSEYTDNIHIDLRSPTKPPQSLNVQVIVLRNAGTIMLNESADNQFYTLNKNEIITLPIDVARHLESTGFVEIAEYQK